MSRYQPYSEQELAKLDRLRRQTPALTWKQIAANRALATAIDALLARQAERIPA